MTDVASILDHLPPAMLVMIRIGGLTIFGPVFGSPIVPVRVKVLLSVLLGLAVYPLVTSQMAEPMPALSLATIAPIIAMELLIGLVIGYLASLPLLAMQTGGLIMGQQMGLGFAQFFNPAIDDEADVIGQVLFFLALAGFLLVGGHEAMVLAVMHSFEHVPLGAMTLNDGLISTVAGLVLASFELALRVAAPLLALIFLESIALGFVSRTVPQLNILSLGFPLRILVGFFIITVGLVVIHEVMLEGIDHGLGVIFGWIESQGASSSG